MCEMRFRQIRLQAQRLRSIVSGLGLPRIERLIVMKNLRTGRRKSRMREREIRIQGDCLQVELLGFLKILEERIGIAFNLMVRSFLGLRLHDTQCGFKLFHRQKSRRIFERQTTAGFGFDPELLFLAKRDGLKIREVPVRWSHAEGSKVHFMKHATVMFLDLVRIRWNALTGKYR